MAKLTEAHRLPGLQATPAVMALITDCVAGAVSQGAVATDRVAKFLGKAGLAPMPAFREQPKQSAPKKKAQERAAAAAAAAG